MHEKEHRHASHASQSQDDDIITSAPRLSSALTAPTSPIASGLLARKARDENGVAAGADAAVATASSSSGHALPDMLMRKFESSLGTDLSGVRVHTGAESAAAAEAVGARAYTVGQDIHFGAGQYDPSSAGGEHLLAHEVAHTVQQAGGPTQPQHKLEVSQPHDPMEHEADRAADAMVAGSPFAVSGGSAGAARKIARERKWDWGVGSKPTVGDGFAKFAVDGSAKVEQGLGVVTVAGQLSLGAEAEVKWKPDASSAGFSGKGSSGKDGKISEQYEAEIPLWKAEAKRAVQAKAEREWTDYFAPTEANLVLGADVSDKPGVTPANRTLAEQSKAKAGESKGSVSVGIKCKTKSGDSYTVKVQLLELAGKGGKVVDVSGPALKANYDKKFKTDPTPVKAGDHEGMLTVAGSVKPELTFKPNYEEIGRQIASGAARAGAEAAVAAAVDAMVLAGPIAMAAIMVAHGIYIAGEKGKRDAAIFEGARDADQAAMVYALGICGNEIAGIGPRSNEAATRARAELAKIAAANNVSVEELAQELRKRPAKDFMLVHGPARQQAMLAYRSEVSKTIAAWRKEHWFHAAFTTQEDDELAVMKNVEIIWKVR